MQGDGDLAAEDVLVDEVERAAADSAELVDGRAEVAAAEQFVVQPAGLERIDVAGQLVAAFAAGGQGLGDRVGGEHAGLHRGVAALDLGEVQGAEVATDQRAAGEDHLRQRIQAALADGPGAVGHALAAFQVLLDHRVVLVALELVERRQVRVAVGQVDDQADEHLVVLQVVEERAAGIFVVQRPAGGMDHQAGLVLGRVDVPDFLDADTVVLGIGLAVQVVFLDQLLADVPAAAFGEQGVLGPQLHAGGVVAFFRVAFAVDAEVAGDDAADHAVLVDQRFLGGEARIDLHAQSFGLLGQPAAEVAQGDDIVALVVHGLGHEEVGHLGSALGALQDVDVVAGHRGIERRAEFLPVGEQLVQRARLEHRAGEDVGAHFGTLLDHADADLLTGFGGLLLQSACGGQTGGAGADDDDVEFHVFAFHYRSPTQGSRYLFIGG